ncbi:MAG: VCBS repeat-containing protein [Deltaproteobacteria bacterium]|nr:VCBS repeat-containing protein [Deltaproteobacteria bacterium]
MMYLKYRILLFSLLTSTLFTFGYHHQAYGLILFDQKVDYQIGSIPSSVAVADFNNDQKVDLAVTNSYDDSVSILLGNDDGTFQAAINCNTGMAPEEVVASDFNGDDKVDLAIANSFDDTISILMGKGDGSFEDGVSYDCGEFPYAMAVADFNGDSKDDLAVANGGGLFSSGDVSLLLGNGDGTFQRATSLTAGSSPTDIHSSDFNGDTYADLTVTNSSDDTVSILLGNGDGTFKAAVNYAVGQSPFGVTGGDFNNDQKEDIAVTNSDTNNLSILLGNGDGTFKAAVNYGTGKWPIAVAAADFDQDGILDLAVANSGNNNLSILKGSGTGAFQLATNAPAGEYPYDLIVSDLNGDAREDLVVVNNNPVDSSGAQERYVVSVLLNSASTCPLNLILSDNSNALALLRNFRNTRLVLNTQGERYSKLYYRHALEVTAMLMRDNDLMEQAKNLLKQLLPVINSLQQSKRAHLNQKMRDKIESLLKKVESQASIGLRSFIYELRDDINSDRLFQSITGLVVP